jgi:hypothetical protein
MDPDIRNKLLTEIPNAVVWFPGIKRIANERTKIDRRLIHSKNKYFLPAGPWAKWLTRELPYFRWFNVMILFIHAIMIGILADINQTIPQNWQLFQILNLSTLVISTFFIMEPIIYCIDNAQDFLEDRWNQCDILLSIAVIQSLLIIKGNFSNHIDDRYLYHLCLQ